MLRLAAPCAFSVLLALAPGTLAAPAGLVVPAAGLAAVASTSAQSSLDRFRLDFDAAVKQGSKAKMDKLVQSQEADAIFTILITAEAISYAPNDILYDRFNALRDTWTRLYDNDFPDRLELYFVNLTQAEKKIRRKIKVEYDKLVKQRTAAETSKDPAELLKVAERYERLAGEFEKIGDKWYESDSLISAGALADEQYHKKKTNLQRVTELYEKGLALREELGVKDLTYKRVHPRLRALVGMGFGSGAAKKPEPVTGKPDETPNEDDPKDDPEDGKAPVAGGALTAKLSFQEIKGLKDDQRPNYYLDEHRQIWPAVQLRAPGSKSDIPRLGPNGPQIIREGAAKVMIDLDRDGTGDMEWPAKGKLDTVVMEIGEGAAKRKWGLMVEVGRTQDFYQGQQMNLAPTSDQMSLFYIPGGYMAGEVAGVEIELYDDNLDGVYGSMPSAWAHTQLKSGMTQPEVDSIRIDGEKMAQPMSQYVNLGSAGWHALTVLNAGTEVSVEPVTFKTGTLQLKAKGVKPDIVILKGNGGVLGETFVNIGGGGKVEVPEGRWDLYFGIVREGKKMQAMKAVILPSDSSPGYLVKEGENVEVTLGAPYSFGFDVSRQQESATVKGMSVQVIGAGGEAYDRFYGAVPQPEAFIRKKGSKRAFESEKMHPAVSLDDLTKYGWDQFWKPLDVLFDTKGEEVEVQLIEKKNKLFGSIESEWL
ncbi:hypothetical protein [Planctomycetes bacterium Poly30]